MQYLTILKKKQNNLCRSVAISEFSYVFCSNKTEQKSAILNTLLLLGFYVKVLRSKRTISESQLFLTIIKHHPHCVQENVKTTSLIEKFSVIFIVATVDHRNVSISSSVNRPYLALRPVHGLLGVLLVLFRLLVQEVLADPVLHQVLSLLLVLSVQAVLQVISSS